METRRLGEHLRGSTYRPEAVRRVRIPKPARPDETRPLGIPTVRDRVVQTALVHVIEPILDHQFHERSFGFRHSRWTIFKALDAKIRSRLRRLLLKRHRKNPKRLPRQHRWPNAYFSGVGLWSLREAHNRFAQSLEGNY